MNILKSLLKLFVEVGSKPWIKNSVGKKDAMLTFSVVGVAVASIATILSAIESVKIGSFELVLSKPDTTLVLGLLSATLGAYVVRRNTKDKYDHLKETTAPAGELPKAE